MGKGYPLYASQLLTEAMPDIDFEFINFGISGNRTCQVFDRLYRDGLSFEPDMISILIGINDIWHRYGSDRIATTDAQIATNYRAMLERIKRESHARIVMLAPYILDSEDKAHIKDDLARILPIIRSLADEFADVYIPLDELFEEAMQTQPEPRFYSDDGVHPNQNGAEFIGRHYAEAVKPLLERL